MATKNAVNCRMRTYRYVTVRSLLDLRYNIGNYLSEMACNVDTTVAVQGDMVPRS